MRESIASTLIWGFIMCGVGIAIAIVLSGCAASDAANIVGGILDCASNTRKCN